MPLNDIQTFFDLNFDLDVVPGPTVFEFIHEYYTRRNCSLDSVMTILQVCFVSDSYGVS